MDPPRKFCLYFVFSPFRLLAPAGPCLFFSEEDFPFVQENHDGNAQDNGPDPKSFF